MIELVARCIIDQPVEQLSFSGIAEASGVSIWALRYNFDDIDGLFRAVALHVIDEVARKSSYETPVLANVQDTIADYARFIAALVQSSEFRDLLLIVLRNNSRMGWLNRFYQERIVQGICSELERRIRLAGEQHGLPVLIREGATHRFYSRIETLCGLSGLLPGSAACEAAEIQRMLKGIVADTFNSTYVFAWAPTKAA